MSVFYMMKFPSISGEEMDWSWGKHVLNPFIAACHAWQHGALQKFQIIVTNLQLNLWNCVSSVSSLLYCWSFGYVSESELVRSCIL